MDPSLDRLVSDFLGDGIAPAEHFQYQFEVHRAYEEVCRETAAIGSSLSGNLAVRPNYAGSRFIDTARDFFMSYRYFRSPGGDLLTPWQLYYKFRAYLAGGDRCPKGSPMGRRIELVRQYRAVREELLAQSEDMFENLDFENSQRLAGLAKRIANILTWLRNPQTDDSLLHLFEGLLSAYAEQGGREGAYHLLELIDVSHDGVVTMPPRFGELIAAAAGNGNIMFRNLFHLLSRPETRDLFYEIYWQLPVSVGEEPEPELYRLTDAAANWPASPVRTEVIRDALHRIISGDDSGMVDEILDMLEDPEEGYRMAYSESLEQYLREEDADFFYQLPEMDLYVGTEMNYDGASAVFMYAAAAPGAYDYYVDAGPGS